MKKVKISKREVMKSASDIILNKRDHNELYSLYQNASLLYNYLDHLEDCVKYVNGFNSRMFYPMEWLVFMRECFSDEQKDRLNVIENYFGLEGEILKEVSFFEGKLKNKLNLPDVIDIEYSLLLGNIRKVLDLKELVHEYVPVFIVEYVKFKKDFEDESDLV